MAPEGPTTTQRTRTKSDSGEGNDSELRVISHPPKKKDKWGEKVDGNERSRGTK